MTLFNVRYVLVSDYGTVEHAGKLVIAGLYTEDMVVPALPAIFSSLVFTVIAETPAETTDYRFTVEAPSGGIVIGAEGRLAPLDNRQGTRPRAIIGFQFNGLVFEEPGDYSVVVASPDGSNRNVIHQYRIVVDPHLGGRDNSRQPFNDAAETPDGKAKARRKA
ncbi:hypothetical protein AC629_13630 [Bradyrhizobium sp. NAS80.1]|uniref:DUF6941 family protein n=1 Tax=Bradyrhizobium sp. NAS80.1 TaxID=1680159 RepID=UPI00095D39A8|nr:hypothetical protein [Bradyrhizobium sp. NAS80.1]OKO87575.1 hypothetical protein AC629_13630 [Bradyrhizobium sp. NAS80.1]